MTLSDHVALNGRLIE